MRITLDNEKCMPYKKHETDAGWDLKINRDSSLMVYHDKLPVLVHTGVYVEIPKGYVGLVLPRSGLGGELEVILANSVGVIDSDYRGEILVYVVNKGKRHYKLAPYERFCQLLVVPVLQEKLDVVTKLTNTKRAENGFGSSGKVESEVNKQEEIWDVSIMENQTPKKVKKV